MINYLNENDNRVNYKWNNIFIKINNDEEYNKIYYILLLIDPKIERFKKTHIWALSLYPIYIRYGKTDNNIFSYTGYSRFSDLYDLYDEREYETIFEYIDVINGLFESIRKRGYYLRVPSYKPKKSNIRQLDEYYKLSNIDDKNKIILENIEKYPYEYIIIRINDNEELKIFLENIKNIEGVYRDDNYSFLKLNLLSENPVFISYQKINNILEFDGWARFSYLNTYINDNNIRFEKIFNISDVKYGLFEQIYSSGRYQYHIKPNYTSKSKIIREGMITKLEYFILEKSSLSALGVPSEVMKLIQSDLAIPSDAKWNRIRFKKDIINIIDISNEVLIIQIGLDSIDVLVSYGNEYNKQYFIDSYVLEDDMDWGGGYNKLPRKTLSKNQFLISIEPKKMLYHLQDEFSIKKQYHRKIFKKEKSFEEFTNNFKKDFLKNFDSILRRIVGQNFKDAKNHVLDKAKKIEVENKMIISGLDNPLKGANSLTILDEMIYQFEDEYSKYFDERLDIQEMSELFTRDKVLTAFIYFVYTGKIMLT